MFVNQLCSDWSQSPTDDNVVATWTSFSLTGSITWQQFSNGLGLRNIVITKPKGLCIAIYVKFCWSSNLAITSRTIPSSRNQKIQICISACWEVFFYKLFEQQKDDFWKLPSETSYDTDLWCRRNCKITTSVRYTSWNKNIKVHNTHGITLWFQYCGKAGTGAIFQFNNTLSKTDDSQNNQFVVPFLFITANEIFGYHFYWQLKGKAVTEHLSSSGIIYQ